MTDLPIISTSEEIVGSFDKIGPKLGQNWAKIGPKLDKNKNFAENP
jgi:hypothetical protein